jgi:hypothetical protein
MGNYSEKEMFEVVKYFKNIYTLINNRIVEKIYFVGNKFYYKKDQFFILYGELVNNENNEFLKWIKGKKVTLELDYINDFKNNAIKKNLKDLIVSSDEFRFEYTDRDGKSQVFLCSNIDNEKYHDIIDTISSIESKLVNSYNLNFNNFEDNLVLFTGNDGEATIEKGEEKIIEFPIKRILSYQSLSKTSKEALGIDKNDEGISYTLNFSDRDENNKRYVKISSESGYVKISQIFATI